MGFGSLKKLVKPAAHISAAIATGGASIPVSAALEQQEAAKQANERARRENAAQAASFNGNPFAAALGPGGFEGSSPMLIYVAAGGAVLVLLVVLFSLKR